MPSAEQPPLPEALPGLDALGAFNLPETTLIRTGDGQCCTDKVGYTIIPIASELSGSGLTPKDGCGKVFEEIVDATLLSVLKRMQAICTYCVARRHRLSNAPSRA